MTAAWLVGAAAVTSALVVWAALRPLVRFGVIDVPANRSLHVVPTPRGGGLGILAAVLLLVPAALLSGGPAIDARLRWLLGGLLVVASLGVLGLVDDFRTLTVSLRLVWQLLVASAWAVTVVVLSEASWLWVPVVLGIVVSVVNITNFMDGANGLIALHAVVAGGWYLLVGLHEGQPGVVLLAAAVLGAAVGFLPFNAPTARVFLGDVGSYTLGGVWAVLCSWLLLVGSSVAVAAAPLFVLFADALVTMVRRALRGERFTEAHRLHVYQRVVAAGWSHSHIALVVAAVTLTTCALAVPVLLVAPSMWLEAASLAAMVLVSCAYLALTTRVDERGRWPAQQRLADR